MYLLVGPLVQSSFQLGPLESGNRTLRTNPPIVFFLACTSKHRRTQSEEVALALLTQLLNVLNTFVPGGGSEHMDMVLQIFSSVAVYLFGRHND